MTKYRLYGVDSEGKEYSIIVELDVKLKLWEIKRDILEGWKQQIEFNNGIKLVSYDVEHLW